MSTSVGTISRVDPRCRPRLKATTHPLAITPTDRSFCGEVLETRASASYVERPQVGAEERSRTPVRRAPEASRWGRSTTLAFALPAQDDAGREPADAQHQLYADVAPERGFVGHDRGGVRDARMHIGSGDAGRQRDSAIKAES